jgi:CHAD domain-containing protein
VLGGETKALHKARVASRRIREALPVVAASAPPAKVKKLRRRLRELTRSLGPVRELDVELGMLENDEESDSVTRHALAMIRREVAAKRHAVRHEFEKNPPVGDIKKLVRKLEKIGASTNGNVEKVEGRTGKKARAKVSKKASKRDEAWRAILASRLLRRAKSLRAAIDAAGPLYASDRIHGVRISTKKLRYALEIAQEAGTPRAGELVKALKRHQERLGRLHDVQGLLKHVREAEASPAVGSRVNDLTVYADSLERECRRLHADFIEHRDSLISSLDEVVHDLVPSLTTATRHQASIARPTRLAKGVHGKRAV